MSYSIPTYTIEPSVLNGIIAPIVRVRPIPHHMAPKAVPSEVMESCNWPIETTVFGGYGDMDGRVTVVCPVPSIYGPTEF